MRLKATVSVIKLPVFTNAWSGEMSNSGPGFGVAVGVGVGVAVAVAVFVGAGVLVGLPFNVFDEAKKIWLFQHPPLQVFVCPSLLKLLVG